jgi:hypothetical protein
MGVSSSPEDFGCPRSRGSLALAPDRRDACSCLTVQSLARLVVSSSSLTDSPWTHLLQAIVRP